MQSVQEGVEDEDKEGHHVRCDGQEEPGQGPQGHQGQVQTRGPQTQEGRARKDETGKEEENFRKEHQKEINYIFYYTTQFI